MGGMLAGRGVAGKDGRNEAWRESKSDRDAESEGQEISE